MPVLLGAGYGWSEVVIIEVGSILGVDEGLMKEVGVALELVRLHAPKKNVHNNIKLAENNKVC
jgi:hypothetical protein